MLKIRSYVKGVDDEVYVRIRNACFGDYEDMRRLSVGEFRKMQEAPNYSCEGLLMAEWDGEVVGMVDAFVDALREEKKGFVQSVSVLPEFRRRGIARELARKALESLRARGMKVANAWAQTDREACISLYGSLGFREIRVFSLMKASLGVIPSDVGEDMGVAVRGADLSKDDEVQLVNRLDNEAFREHFNFRPRSVEETRFMLFEDPGFQVQRWFFAEVAGKPAGYLGAGVDIGLNEEKGLKWGWILDIGVLKPYRRQGVGARLMLHGMRVLKDMGMSDAVLYVDDMNLTGAIKLYERVGFTVFRRNLTLELKL